MTCRPTTCARAAQEALSIEPRYPLARKWLDAARARAEAAAHAAERELLLLDDGAPTAPRAKPGRARSAGAADGALRATRRTRARNSRQRRGHGSVNDAASTLDADDGAPRASLIVDPDVAGDSSVSDGDTSRGLSACPSDTGGGARDIVRHAVRPETESDGGEWVVATANGRRASRTRAAEAKQKADRHEPTVNERTPPADVPAAVATRPPLSADAAPFPSPASRASTGVAELGENDNPPAGTTVLPTTDDAPSPASARRRAVRHVDVDTIRSRARRPSRQKVASKLHGQLLRLEATAMVEAAIAVGQAKVLGQSHHVSDELCLAAAMHIQKTYTGDMMMRYSLLEGMQIDYFSKFLRIGMTDLAVADGSGPPVPVITGESSASGDTPQGAGDNDGCDDDSSSTSSSSSSSSSSSMCRVEREPTEPPDVESPAEAEPPHEAPTTTPADEYHSTRERDLALELARTACELARTRAERDAAREEVERLRRALEGMSPAQMPDSVT